MGTLEFMDAGEASWAQRKPAWTETRLDFARRKTREGWLPRRGLRFLGDDEGSLAEEFVDGGLDDEESLVKEFVDGGLGDEEGLVEEFVDGGLGDEEGLLEEFVDGGLVDEESLVEEFADGGLGDEEGLGDPAAWVAPVVGCPWSTICLRISICSFAVNTC